MERSAVRLAKPEGSCGNFCAVHVKFEGSDWYGKRGADRRAARRNSGRQEAFGRQSDETRSSGSLAAGAAAGERTISRTAEEPSPEMDRSLLKTSARRFSV